MYIWTLPIRLVVEDAISRFGRGLPRRYLRRHEGFRMYCAAFAWIIFGLILISR
jgi:hypothetical protein